MIIVYTMRKILLLFLAVMSLTSCATTAHFYQIATIASTQIRISDEGKFLLIIVALTLSIIFGQNMANSDS